LREGTTKQSAVIVIGLLNNYTVLSNSFFFLFLDEKKETKKNQD
jgi:hypothetical protein